MRFKRTSCWVLSCVLLSGFADQAAGASLRSMLAAADEAVHGYPNSRAIRDVDANGILTVDELVLLHPNYGKVERAVERGVVEGPSLSVSTVYAVPGQDVTFEVSIGTGPTVIGGMQNDLTFDIVNTPITRRCRINPDLLHTLSFALPPGNCPTSPACFRALVIDFAALSPIPDGVVLYTCEAEVSTGAAPGAYPLTLSNVIFSTPVGQRIGDIALFDGSVVVTDAVCGDEIVELPEECDDGNTLPGDCCSPTCQVEAPCIPNPCGNGMIDSPEECDDGNILPGDCCNHICQIEPACMPGPVCGDGLVEDPEECDDGNTSSGDCCSPFCRFEPGRLCRAVSGACDVPEFCPVDSASCPTDSLAVDGTNCEPNSGVACTLDDVCSSGTCIAPSGDQDDNGICDADDVELPLELDRVYMHVAKTGRSNGLFRMSGVLVASSGLDFVQSLVDGSVELIARDADGSFEFGYRVTPCRLASGGRRVVCQSVDRRVRVVFVRQWREPTRWRVRVRARQLSTVVTGERIPGGHALDVPVSVRLRSAVGVHGVDTSDCYKVYDRIISCQ